MFQNVVYRATVYRTGVNTFALFNNTLLFFLMFSGALDTSKIHIVSKHSINDTAMKNAPNKVLNLPFEATFRLQVSGIHLIVIGNFPM